MKTIKHTVILFAQIFHPYAPQKKGEGVIPNNKHPHRRETGVARPIPKGGEASQRATTLELPHAEANAEILKLRFHRPQ
ncbi:unnamed protein product [Callosobruchus maculatus]|uniref:Uncharacterized protein n=1 Tax=Callosobruchus maculatus TaxID=64391 RepID=A0A653BYT5_CALMS|nr:unnamed protein product [Callosobruchus maculatus]